MNHPTPNDATHANSYVPLSRGLDEHLPGFPPAALKVYLHLLINARFSAPSKGRHAANFSDLTIALGMSYRQIERAVEWLEDHSYITCQRAPNQHGVSTFEVLRYKSAGDFAHDKNVRSDVRGRVTAERERCQEQGDGRVTAEDATSCQGNDLAAPKNGENGKNLENGENTIPPTPQRGKVSVSRKRKSPLPEQHSEEGRRLAELLRDRILQNNPEHIPITEKQIVAWAKDADLMMRRDGRTEARIREVMDWSQQDKFWRANVLSMGTLRMQFDRLAVKVRDGNGATSQSRPERGGLTQGELEREIAKEERGRNATVAQ